VRAEVRELPAAAIERGLPADELADHYRRLVEHAVAGDIRLDVERVALDSVADAWRRQAEGAGTKLVVVP